MQAAVSRSSTSSLSSPVPKRWREFGAYEDSEVADRLGNLVLVEKSINASLGNRPYSQKRSVYLQSQLLLTRALAERPRVGKSTKIDLAVVDLEPYEEWNEPAVVARQAVLTKLARSVWAVGVGT